MTEAEKYLRSFLQDLENEQNAMQDSLRNYEGRCDQLKIDIKRLEFAIMQGKEAIERIKEIESNDRYAN